MHDPASKDLIRRLEQFTACQERDLQGCRAYIRLLSKDLPTFDSLWLDALVQSRKLTPFQADRLATGREETLKVGPYQLIQQLQQDRTHLRYLAYHPQSGQRVLMEEHRKASSFPEDCLAELREVRSRLGSQSPGLGLVPPQDFLIQDKSLFVIHPLEQGLTARELLIRRGRFPENLVRLLTQQLLRQLACLASSGLVHGDLRAGNLLLGHRGQISLFNTGVRPAMSPQWTLQADLPFEAYDTFAPEVVKTGHWSHQADLYSAGCLLWQLSCGRPPLHSADSLLKLRAHLTRSIPDVREYAPDIDTETAEIIFRLTRRNPDERGDLLREGQEYYKRSRAFSGQSVKTFIRDFEHPLTLPTQAAISPRRQQGLILTTACLLMIGLGLGSSYLGLPTAFSRTGATWKLSIAQQMSGKTKSAEEPPKTHAHSSSENLPLEPLPALDESGQLWLTPGHRYRAEDLSAVGPLKVAAHNENVEPSAEKTAASTGEPPVIVVNSEPWRIWGTHVLLENICIQYESPAPELAGPSTDPTDTESTTATLQSAVPQSEVRFPAALLVCQSLSFRIENSQVQVDDRQTLEQTARTRGIAWKPLSSQESGGGQLQLINTQFHLPGASLMLGGPAQTLQISNCLKTGRGDFLEFSDQFSQNHYPSILCEHVTLRQADSLLNLHFVQTSQSTPVTLNIEATNCVFDLIPQAAGLITLTATEPPQDFVQRLNLWGQILLLTPQMSPIAWYNPEIDQSTRLELPGTLEGVLNYPIQFSQADSIQMTGCTLENYAGPRWNSVAPGIRAAELTPLSETTIR